ncbi:MAG: hypothetical protein ACRD6W_19090 [Nitrososphaerales archaeon]
MMHPVLRQLWKDMWGPELTLGDVVLVMEHMLLKQGKSELEVAAHVGKFVGKIFKSRERLAAYFVGEKD